MRSIGSVFWIGQRRTLVAADLSESTHESVVEYAAFLSPELMRGLSVVCKILLLASIDVSCGIHGLGVET